MYPEHIVAPMRAELTDIGFEELQTSDAVDNYLKQDGTSLLVINSVCGCAAGAARPGVRLAIQDGQNPDRVATVFAGVDKPAVDRARQHLLPYPPSSPAIGLFKDGKLVHFIERHHIEGRSAEMIAENLQMAFDEHCK